MSYHIVDHVLASLLGLVVMTGGSTLRKKVYESYNISFFLSRTYGYTGSGEIVDLKLGYSRKTT